MIHAAHRAAGVLVALVVSLFACSQGTAFGQELSEGTPAPDSDARFYEVPKFAFTDRGGETVTLEHCNPCPFLK